MEELQQLKADIHYGLAAATNETNDAEGCLYHTKILLDLRLCIFEATGTLDLRLAVAHNEVGIAWVMNGQHQNGVTAFKRSIEVFKLLPEAVLAIDTNPRTNLAFTYWVMGDLEDAGRTFEDLLRDRETRFGTVLGNANHKTADLMYRVAQHCLRRGECNQARSLLNKALKVWRMKESIFVPEIARAHFLMAKILSRHGNYAEANSALQQAAARRKEIGRAHWKEDSDLVEHDFDELLTFYDR
nr:hypothetical protein B0A51_13883 [Rachicladosporium sp. CCFEE 5018]